MAEVPQAEINEIRVTSRNGTLYGRYLIAPYILGRKLGVAVTWFVTGQPKQLLGWFKTNDEAMVFAQLEADKKRLLLDPQGLGEVPF